MSVYLKLPAVILLAVLISIPSKKIYGQIVPPASETPLAAESEEKQHRSSPTIITFSEILACGGKFAGNLENSGFLPIGNLDTSLIVEGNYKQNSDASLGIQIENYTSYNHLTIKGKTQLDGSVQFQFNQFIPAEGSRFSFLTAEGGINGTFSESNIPPGYPLEIVYNSNSVELVVSSGPQIVENAVMTKDPDAIIFTASVLRTSLQPLIPMRVGNIKNIIFNATNIELMQITNRLGAVRAGVENISFNGLSQEPMQETFSKRQTIIKKNVQLNTSIWASASGIYSRIDNIYSLPKMDSITGFFAVGADYNIHPAIKVGAYTGYQGSKAWYPDDSWLRSNGVKFGIYGTAQYRGFYLNAIVGGGANFFHLHRSINMSKYYWTACSNPFAGELDSLFGGGYEYQLGPWRLGANTSVQYTYLGISSFDESGAGNLSTRVGSQHPNSLLCSLGGNISYLWKPSPHCIILPTVGLSWQYEFCDNGERINGRFANGKGVPFYFYTQAGSRNYVFGTAGISAQIQRRLGLYAYYNPQSGSNQISHGVLLGLNCNF